MARGEVVLPIRANKRFWYQTQEGKGQGKRLGRALRVLYDWMMPLPSKVKKSVSPTMTPQVQVRHCVPGDDDDAAQLYKLWRRRSQAT